MTQQTPDTLSGDVMHVDEESVIAQEYPFGADAGDEPTPEAVVAPAAQQPPPGPRRAGSKALWFWGVIGVVVVAVGAVAIHIHSNNPAPMPPEMAAIAREANTVPVEPKRVAGAEAPTRHAAVPAAAVAAPAHPVPVSSGIPATGLPSPVPATKPVASPATQPSPAHPSALAPVSPPVGAASTRATPDSPPATSAKATSSTISAEEYADTVQERDEAQAQVKILREQLSKARVEASRHRATGGGAVTVRAILKDGVVLAGPHGKPIIVPTGGTVHVTPTQAAVEH